MSLFLASQWKALTAVVLLQVYTIGLIVYSFTLWVGPFMAEFGTERSPIMLTAGISGMVMAAMSPIAGHLADRVAPRTLMLIGLSVFSAGFFLLSMVQHLWQVWLIYGAFAAVGAGLAGPVTCQTFVARSFDRHKGLALGISSAGTALGGLLLPPLIALLIGTIGWRSTHALIAVAGFAILAPVVWFMVDRNRPEAKHGAEASSDGGWTHIREAKLWIIILTFIPLGMVFSSLQFNLAPLVADRGMGLTAAGLATSGMAFAMICGKVTVGGLTDRIDHRALYWMLALSMVGAVLCMTLTSMLGGLAVAVVLLGIAGCGFYPLISSIVARNFPAAHFGRVLGLCFLFLNASLLGPLIAAYARDITGSYAAALQIMVLMLAPASLLAFFLSSRASPALKPVKLNG